MWVYLSIASHRRRRASTKTGRFFTKSVHDPVKFAWTEYQPSKVELAIAKKRAAEKGFTWQADEIRPKGFRTAPPWAQSTISSPTKKIPIEHQKII